jgi:ribosomal protein S8
MPVYFLNQSNSNIKIYSKNGNAGGYISDVMFLDDEENKVKYFLSVSILNYKQKSYLKRRVIYTSPGIDVFRKISKILYDYAKNQKP